MLDAKERLLASRALKYYINHASSAIINFETLQAGSQLCDKLNNYQEPVVTADYAERNVQSNCSIHANFCAHKKYSQDEVWLKRWNTLKNCIAEELEEPFLDDGEEATYKNLQLHMERIEKLEVD